MRDGILGAQEMVAEHLGVSFPEPLPPPDDATVPELDLRCVRPAVLPLALPREPLAAIGRDRHAADGFLLGREPGGRPVALSGRALARHLYVLGATGTGKSTLLARLAEHLLPQERAFVLLDPHGDLAGEVLDLVPPARRRDVV